MENQYKECNVRAEISGGSIASEKVAYIKIIGGKIAEVVVPTSRTGKDYFSTEEICRKGNNVLIALPREATDGAWRVWVEESELVNKTPKCMN